MKVSPLYFLFLIFFAVGCNPPSNLYFSEKSIPTASSASSVEAFSKTVYPITRTNCISCHATATQPFHANADVTTAHNAIISNGKVDFTDVSHSRLVSKVRSGHNCWSDCESNAIEIESQITAWKTLSATNQSNTVVEKWKTATIRIQDVVNATDVNRDWGTKELNITSAILTNSFQLVNQEPAPYLFMPWDGGGYYFNYTTAGTATFNFSMSEPGAYNVWGYVDNGAFANQEIGLYYRFNDSDYKGFIQERSIGFGWRKFYSTDSGTATPVVLNITDQSTQKLFLQELNNGMKISRIVITNDPDFVGDDFISKPIYSFKFNISSLVNKPNSFLEFEMDEFDEYTYRLHDIRVVIPDGRLALRGVKIYLNGKFSTQSSSYYSINQIVTSSTPDLFPSTMMLAKEQGLNQDSLAVAFENLEWVE